MYLIKYTLSVKFLIKDYKRQLHNNNILNMAHGGIVVLKPG